MRFWTVYSFCITTLISSIAYADTGELQTSEPIVCSSAVKLLLQGESPLRVELVALRRSVGVNMMGLSAIADATQVPIEDVRVSFTAGTPLPPGAEKIKAHLVSLPPLRDIDYNGIYHAMYASHVPEGTSVDRRQVWAETAINRLLEFQPEMPDRISEIADKNDEEVFSWLLEKTFKGADDAAKNLAERGSQHTGSFYVVPLKTVDQVNKRGEEDFVVSLAVNPSVLRAVLSDVLEGAEAAGADRLGFRTKNFSHAPEAIRVTFSNQAEAVKFATEMKSYFEKVKYAGQKGYIGGHINYTYRLEGSPVHFQVRSETSGRRFIAENLVNFGMMVNGSLPMTEGRDPQSAQPTEAFQRHIVSTGNWFHIRGINPETWLPHNFVNPFDPASE